MHGYTIRRSLAAISSYPIPAETITEAALLRGLDPEAAMTRETLRTNAYRLASADLYRFLSLAPDVTEGGQSYRLTEDARERYAILARSLYRVYGSADDLTDDTDHVRTTYGYKGSRL